ncbi:MAG: D-tyrosyl-tRNA(Tyr) deacylase, partial [Methanoregulaceae archaeon]|nr:D-tyrosyl-tRNA(Tyr) deacylase [Methanoregulaceae archaeon]
MPREPGYGAGCRIALVSSRQDPAGRNIGGCVRDLLDQGPGIGYPDHGYRFIPLEVEERLIWQDGFDRQLPADLICFLSRHSSERPSPVLTTHVTGNFRTAAFGGIPGSLPPAAPAFMHAVLAELAVFAPPGYRVSYEVTHHGPTELHIPSLFVEIGSNPAEWGDPDAGMAVARSVLSAAPAGDEIPLVGFGGTHYARRETEIALGSRGAFGHMVHSRELPFLTGEQVALMGDRTCAVAAYIDKKAVPAADFTRVDRLIAGAGLVRLSEGDITGMGGLS